MNQTGFKGPHEGRYIGELSLLYHLLMSSKLPLSKKTPSKKPLSRQGSKASNSANIKTTKTQLRAHFKQKRRNISTFRRKLLAQQAATHLQKSTIFKQAQNIAVYWPSAHEFDAQPIIQSIHQSNKNCYLPIVKPNHAMHFAQYQRGQVLKPNQYGILEPDNLKTIRRDLLDLIIVPLLAFNKRGTRLGMGGGYYDRFLAGRKSRKPVIVGIGYKEQECANLTRQTWDVKMDKLSINGKIFNCR